MNKQFLQIGSLVLLLAVILGAFGAHSLAQVLDEKRQHTFEIGIRYQFYHGFALLLVGIVQQYFPARLLRIAGWLFLAGIVCFCGSLYLLACRDVLALTSWKWLGPITPIGGTFFIVAWFLFFLGVRKA